MDDTRRKILDCRKHPSEKNCSLTISGTESEVLAAGVAHAVSAHGHQDTPELRKLLAGAMEAEKR